METFGDNRALALGSKKTSKPCFGLGSNFRVSIELGQNLQLSTLNSVTIEILPLVLRDRDK